jgi:hypothetical protein
MSRYTLTPDDMEWLRMGWLPPSVKEPAEVRLFAKRVAAHIDALTKLPRCEHGAIREPCIPCSEEPHDA